MENKVGVPTPTSLKELHAEQASDGRWILLFPQWLSVLCASFPVSITLRVILVFQDTHLSCNVAPQIKPITSSCA